MEREEQYCVLRCQLRKLFDNGVKTIGEAIVLVDEMYFIETGQMEEPKR